MTVTQVDSASYQCQG